MISTLRAPPPWHDDQPIRERDPEIDIDRRRIVQEAVDVAIVQRLGPKHLGPGLEPRDDEGPVVTQAEAADQLAGDGVEGDDMRARPRPSLVTRPLTLPVARWNAPAP